MMHELAAFDIDHVVKWQARDQRRHLTFAATDEEDGKLTARLRGVVTIPRPEPDLNPPGRELGTPDSAEILSQ
jgi:hypothetical protein